MALAAVPRHVLCVRLVALAPFVSLAGASGCFEATETLGSACEKDHDCDPAQSCDNGVCGLCGNGRVDPGEFCFGPSRDYAVPGVIAGVFAADLDGEGDLDIAAVTNDFCATSPTEFGPCFRSVLLVSSGPREYTVIDAGADTTFDARVSAFDVADLDGDGRFDAVIAFEDAPGLLVVFALADAADAPDPIVLQTSAPVVDVLIEDIDGDGILDLATGSRAPMAPVEMFWGMGGGAYTSAQPVPAGAGARLSRGADFDGDGRMEFAVANLLESSVTVLRNVGDRNFDVASTVPLPGLPAAIAAGDLDGDELPEVVASVVQLDLVVVAPNVAGTVVGTDLIELEAPSLPAGLLLSDGNEDGALDIFVAGNGTDRVGVFLNRGGTFPDRVDLDVGPAPLFMIRQDIDGDGAADMIVANGSSTISIIYPDF
ncbi:MAG: VCBS repeat-containing protein [Deltaproteobacteria bacterium]|nr:MAG: VCBS repeat-containing protein [Deltaproteobacteria bacterium]